MRWLKGTDEFVLSRQELGDFLTFSLTWYCLPEDKRPCGYDEFCKEILAKTSSLLLQYWRSIK